MHHLFLVQRVTGNLSSGSVPSKNRYVPSASEDKNDLENIAKDELRRERAKLNMCVYRLDLRRPLSFWRW
ncbi:hypothetical protein Bca4012_004076 [Brassica carinata]